MPTYLNDLYSLSADSTMHLSFHQALIADMRRLRAFCNATKQIVQPGDMVMDIGVGTGVLTLAAIEAGASKVICIDDDDVILLARETFHLNGCTRKTRLVRGNFLDLRFKGRSPDVIVAELLGNFALAENITELAVHIRRQFPNLKRIVPAWFELTVAPVEDFRFDDGLRVFEKPVDGMDLSHFHEAAIHNIYTRNVTKKQLLSKPECLARYELLEIETPDVDVKTSCTVTRKGTLHGVAGWFRSGLTDDIVMETGPFHPRVHWEDVIFPVASPVEVEPGDKVSFRFEGLCHGSGDVWSWVITVSRDGKMIARSRHDSDERLPRGRVPKQRIVGLS